MLSKSLSKKAEVQEAEDLETHIGALLANAQFEGHPLREALCELLERYQEQSAQIERIASISDGYQTMLRERSESLAQRNARHLRQLQKIVRISDHYQKMLHEQSEQLKISAMHDALTGLPNRRFMGERLAESVALAARGGAQFSLVVLDVDHFKNINDAFGHQTGDRALVGIANIMTADLRGYDMAARWGGEEFLLLFPETGAHGALEVAERIRRSIEGWLLESEDGPLKFSASFGVAQHQSGETANQTLARADRALYRAKNTGRNKVVIFDAELDRKIQ